MNRKTWAILENFVYPTIWFDQVKVKWCCRLYSHAGLSMKDGKIHRYGRGYGEDFNINKAIKQAALKAASIRKSAAR